MKKFPTAFTILFILGVVAVLTWMIPAGEHDRTLDPALGREAVLLVIGCFLAAVASIRAIAEGSVLRPERSRQSLPRHGIERASGTAPKAMIQATMRTSLVAIGALAMAAAVPSSANAQSLDRFRSSGIVHIGHRIDARPFSFVDADGKPAGYTVELCGRIVEAISAAVGRDVRTEYVALGAEERFQAVAEGRVDLHCGAATATLARRETVSFSLPIFVTGVSAVLPSDSPRFLVDLLAGRTAREPTRETVRQSMQDWTFAVRSATTAETWLRESIETLAPRASVVTVGDHAEGIAGVAAGTFDAYFADRALLQGQLQQFESTDGFILSERLFTHEPYGIVLPRGDEDLRLIVDRTLSRLFRSGEYREVFEKYFGRPDGMQSVVLSISALPE